MILSTELWESAGSVLFDWDDCCNGIFEGEFAELIWFEGAVAAKALWEVWGKLLEEDGVEDEKGEEGLGWLGGGVVEDPVDGIWTGVPA